MQDTGSKNTQTCLRCGGLATESFDIGFWVPICVSCKYTWADRSPFIARSVLKNIHEKMMKMVVANKKTI